MLKNFALLFALASAFALSACAALQAPPEAPSQEEISRHYRFPDVPFPKDFKLDRDKSFIYEAKESNTKVGRLYYKGYDSISHVVEFYQNEMINNGWTEVRIIEHSGTIMLFEKESKICHVIVQSGLTTSTVEIQIGPR